MPNIVVTSKGTNGVLVDFGNYAGQTINKTVLPSSQGFNSLNLMHVIPKAAGVEIQLGGRDPQKFFVSHDTVADADGVSFLIIDTIDAAGPSDQDDLIDKLTSLM